MEVSFYSVNDENEKVCFKSLAEKNNNQIIFQDKSLSNTMIYLTILKDKLIFERKGDCNMKIELKNDKKTLGFYSNEIGLEFNFETKCKELIIKDKRIDIQYDMILDNSILSSHKIWIIMR